MKKDTVYLMSVCSDSVVDDPQESNRIAARHAELILSFRTAQQRIDELEAIVAQCNDNNSHPVGSDTCESDYSTGSGSGQPTVPRRRRLSFPLLNQPHKENGVRRIAEFNLNLVETIDKLRKFILKMGAETDAQLILLNDEVERLHAEKDVLRRENEALKERVADDVLRQRQANLVETGMKKAVTTARMRSVGLRCLENTEAVLMEKNDDMYYAQRFDAAKLPVRNVTFVVHIVGGVVFPLSDAEEFTMSVYRKLLFSIARLYDGYHVSSVRNLDVFAFQSAICAVRFARESHDNLLKVDWVPRTSDISAFAPLVDNGKELFHGPRLHSCLYSVANPGCEVDPVTGRAVYFGPEIRDAISAAITGAPIGEIVANAQWGERFVCESCLLRDTKASTKSISSAADAPDVAEVRARLGPHWSVIAARTPVESLCYSVLPASLEGRRGLPPYLLHPTERLACGGAADADTLLQDVLRAMKGVSRVASGPKESWVEGFAKHDRCAEGGENSAKDDGTLDNGAEVPGGDLLALFSLRHEREHMIWLFRKLEGVCTRHEENAMNAEDRYNEHRHIIDEKEMAFVCTVDTGSAEAWRALSEGSGSTPLMDEEEKQLRDKLISTVYANGWRCNGFLVNGDATRVFTFAFREPAQVLDFAAQVYTFVEESVEKVSQSRLRETSTHRGICANTFEAHDGVSSTTSNPFIFRSGIACGPLFAFEPRNSPLSMSGTTLCRGPAVSISGALCDMARGGEILATAEALQAFYATRTNLASMAYNVLRLGCRFPGTGTAGIDVCSVLPKAFAARRQMSLNVPRMGESNILFADTMTSSNFSVRTVSNNAASNNKVISPSSTNIPDHKKHTRFSSSTRIRGKNTVKSSKKNNSIISINNSTSETATTVPHHNVCEVKATRSVRAAMCLDVPLLTRSEVSSMLEQQQRMMERAEAAAMSSHDTAWDLSAQQQLRMKWIFNGSAGVRRTELGFLYCDATDISHILSALPADTSADVLAHYNYIVQSALLAHDGVVARTDSISAYIALFRDPRDALEAAMTVQRGLLAAEWPARLHTLEETLHVRSAVSGKLLFRGVRAAMAVHSSTAYAWNASGAALQAVVALGQVAHGGEVLVTLPVLARVSSSLSGSLLLQQLDLRTALSVPESAASCVPRVVGERHDIFASAAGAGEGPRRHSRQRGPGDWPGATGVALALPPARRAPWAETATTEGTFGSVGRDADAIVAHLKRETASMVETNAIREGFLAVTCDTLAGLATAYRALDDAVTKENAAKEVALVLPQNSMTTVIKVRNIKDPARKTPLNRGITSPLLPQDPFHAAIHSFDTTLRSALQHCASVLAGGVMQTSPEKKTAVQRTPRRKAQKS